MSASFLELLWKKLVKLQKSHKKTYLLLRFGLLSQRQRKNKSLEAIELRLLTISQYN